LLGEVRGKRPSFVRTLKKERKEGGAGAGCGEER